MTGVLDGKVALVTGAASGIGLATARLFAEEGATVCVVDRDAGAGERAAASVSGSFVQADVSDPGCWPLVVSSVTATCGGIDICHLNAGVTTGSTTIDELTDEQYRRITSVNVDGVVFGVRAVVPEMRRRGGGAIVATSSLAGLVAFPVDPVYTLTKHAVVGFVRALAQPLAADGITINAVCPGLVDTPLIDGEVRDALAASEFPLIEPRAVAEAVLWCVTGGASGEAVVVQLGREPIAYRFNRAPGPRAEGAEGRIPPSWLADPSMVAGPAGSGESAGSAGGGAAPQSS